MKLFLNTKRASRTRKMAEAFAVPARVLPGIMPKNKKTGEPVDVNVSKVKLKPSQWNGDNVAFDDTDKEGMVADAFDRIYDILEQGIRFTDDTKLKNKKTGLFGDKNLEKGTINIPYDRIGTSTYHDDALFIDGPISDAEYKLIRIAILGTKAELVPHGKRGIEITNLGTGSPVDYEPTVDYDSDVDYENPMHEGLNKGDSNYEEMVSQLTHDVYNALADVMFKYRNKGVSKDTLDEAIEWFQVHFYEGDWDDESSLEESKQTVTESMNTIPQFKRKDK